MKSLILAIAVLFVSQAQAEVKPYGTLVPVRCAQEVTSSNGVTGVCISAREGMEGQWLSISVQNETGRVQEIALPIVEIQPGNSGITGKLESVLVILAEDDIRHVVHGLGTPSDIRSLNGDMFGYDFQASGFDFVLVTL